MSASWCWDSNRQSYYYYSIEEASYVYQDGMRIPAATEASSTQAVTQTVTQAAFSNHDHDAPETATDDADIVSSMASLNFGHYGGYPSQSSEYVAQTTQNYTPASTSSQTTYPAQSSSSANSYTAYTAPGRLDNWGDILERRLEVGPKKQITDTELYRKGVKARLKIKSTPGKEEVLDPRFKKRRTGFFMFGKVFKVLWPEAAGYSHSGGEASSFVSDGMFGEPIVTKIRWFLVIKEGSGYCSCLPISTYSQWGVAKEGIIKGEHAIVYTGKEPRLQPTEAPEEGELPMMDSIRVVAVRKGDKLDPMSRVNFRKVYTVEHNVKVYDFGSVHKDYLDLLRCQWNWVLDSFGRNSNKAVEVDEEDEEVDED